MKDGFTDAERDTLAQEGYEELGPETLEFAEAALPVFNEALKNSDKISEAHLPE